ncbi:MAG: hypothetical protein ABSE80_13205 [Halobacteriota archaeon]|jgi:hypothetical protein
MDKTAVWNILYEWVKTSPSQKFTKEVHAEMLLKYPKLPGYTSCDPQLTAMSNSRLIKHPNGFKKGWVLSGMLDEAVILAFLQHTDKQNLHQKIQTEAPELYQKYMAWYVEAQKSPKFDKTNSATVDGILPSSASTVFRQESEIIDYWIVGIVGLLICTRNANKLLEYEGVNTARFHDFVVTVNDSGIYRYVVDTDAAPHLAHLNGKEILLTPLQKTAVDLREELYNYIKSKK